MSNAGDLPHDEILKLRAAVISAGLTKSRHALLAGISAAFVAGLSDEGAPGTQILSDLDALNATGELGDGTVPLAVWLRNAVELAGPRKEAEVFRRALDQLGDAGQAPRPQDAPSQRTGTSGGVAHFNLNISGTTLGALAVGPGAKAQGNVTLGSSMPQPQGPAAAPQGSGSTQPTADTPIDFAILTAIEVERKAVCAAFGLTEKHKERKDGRTYWRGKLPLKNGEHYEIVVGQPRDMGQVEAALLATDVIRHWSPNSALLVGIAASTDKDVKLGDVVVGRSVYYYEHGKVTAEGTKPQPEMILADAALLDAAVTLDWEETVPHRPDGTETAPKRHLGVIASGEKVIASAAARDAITAPNRKILALEMEGYGFSRAMWQSFEHVRHLDIRGICDDGSEKKDDRWHGYAAAAAAGFAKHFLLDRPLEPRYGTAPPRP